MFLQLHIWADHVKICQELTQDMAAQLASRGIRVQRLHAQDKHRHAPLPSVTSIQ